MLNNLIYLDYCKTTSDIVMNVFHKDVLVNLSSCVYFP